MSSLLTAVPRFEELVAKLFVPLGVSDERAPALADARRLDDLFEAGLMMYGLIDHRDGRYLYLSRNARRCSATRPLS
ncbi:MAG: hypothetical protein WBA12_09060 [Catalinimonas sp.]